MNAIPRIFLDHDGGRLALIAGSFLRLTGRQLTAGKGDIAQALWDAPLAIVAHGTQADPLFFFGNRQALALFEMTPQDFVTMPSRLSAEPDLRSERAALMARVTQGGFINDYSGVRISATGRRFRIQQATAWNLDNAAGTRHGQAAAFRDWTFLD
jgi:hypothetical protein